MAKIRKLELRFWNSEATGDCLLDGKPTVQGRLFQVDENQYLIDGQSAGQRGCGWAAVGSEKSGIAVGVREFWQNWPKAISCGPGRVSVELCPELPAGLYDGKPLEEENKLYYALRDGVHTFKVGVAKTHELWVNYFAGKPDARRLGEFFQAAEEPLLATADPALRQRDQGPGRPSACRSAEVRGLRRLAQPRPGQPLAAAGQGPRVRAAELWRLVRRAAGELGQPRIRLGPRDVRPVPADGRPPLFPPRRAGGAAPHRRGRDPRGQPAAQESLGTAAASRRDLAALLEPHGRLLRKRSAARRSHVPDGPQHELWARLGWRRFRVLLLDGRPAGPGGRDPDRRRHGSALPHRLQRPHPRPGLADRAGVERLRSHRRQEVPGRRHRMLGGAEEEPRLAARLGGASWPRGIASIRSGSATATCRSWKGCWFPPWLGIIASRKTRKCCGRSAWASTR